MKEAEVILERSLEYVRSQARKMETYETVAMLREQLEAAHKEIARLNAGPHTLFSKRLDPDCWSGCKSLVINQERDEAREKLKLALESNSKYERNFLETDQKIRDLEAARQIAQNNYDLVSESHSKAMKDLTEARNEVRQSTELIRKVREILVRAGYLTIEST